MRRRKKMILMILLLAVIALVIGGLYAFRTQPIIPEDGAYLLHVENEEGNVIDPGFYLWPQGPDDTYQTREYVVITEEEEQAVLEILSRYEKRLEREKVWWIPVQQFFPQHYAGVKVEMPEWLEAQVVVYDVSRSDGEIFNIVLGDGHAQQRQEHTFHPPYYTIEDEGALYEELSEILNLKSLLAQ